MSSRLSPEEIELLARRRAGAKIGWYLHAFLYVVVNTALFAASHYGLRQRPWSALPVIGWGVGLAFHGISVFLLGKGRGLRERLVARERERLAREQDRRW